MIEVKNLVKRYGSHLAVNHLNFTVEKGEIYGFLGPNGAGKSTTMNIMTGYLGATEGEVLINGHNILEEPELAKKSIGYLPEIPPLYTDMTVKEYLTFAAELKKIPKKEWEEQIAETVELVKLEEVENRLIRNLSKGYRQRVGLAQAILGFPEIIILDEPTVGLDPKQIIEIRELIRELAKNHTVILSSHILAEVQEVCDRVMIISHGELVASDTPEKLEELMQGEKVVRILAKADAKETVETILERIGHIEMVEYTETENGYIGAEIQPKDGADIREELFFAFAKAECPLIEMAQKKISLEEVFLELTQNESAAEDEKEEEDVDNDDEEETIVEEEGKEDEGDL